MKIILDRNNDKFNSAEEKINTFEDIATKTVQIETQRE